MKAAHIKDGYRRSFFWLRKLNQCVWRLPSENGGGAGQNEPEYVLRGLVNTKCLEIQKLLDEYYGPRLAQAELAEIRAEILWA